MAGPILPRNPADPAGTDRRERAAIRAFDVRLRQLLAAYREALGRLRYQAITVNEVRYEFDLSPDILANLLAELAAIVDRLLLEGGQDRLWLTQEYVIPSYQQGTAAAWANLGAQSTAYAATRPALEALLLSEPYRRRISYLRAREFELMQGFSGEVKTRAAMILSDGLAAGQHPRTIAKTLSEGIDIDRRRAERIARTEVPNALRQARMDETQQAQQELGLRIKLMHMSALSPTTRPTHRARHAHLYSVQQQRDWWATKPNSINCKCSTVEVLVDDKGNPLTPGVVSRARRMLDASPA